MSKKVESLLTRGDSALHSWKHTCKGQHKAFFSEKYLYYPN